MSALMFHSISTSPSAIIIRLGWGLARFRISLANLGQYDLLWRWYCPGHVFVALKISENDDYLLNYSDTSA